MKYGKHLLSEVIKNAPDQTRNLTWSKNHHVRKSSPEPTGIKRAQ
jgi:hypothetical protein